MPVGFICFVSNFWTDVTHLKISPEKRWFIHIIAWSVCNCRAKRGNALQYKYIYARFFSRYCSFLSFVPQEYIWQLLPTKKYIFFWATYRGRGYMCMANSHYNERPFSGQPTVTINILLTWKDKILPDLEVLSSISITDCIKSYCQLSNERDFKMFSISRLHWQKIEAIRNISIGSYKVC